VSGTVIVRYDSHGEIEFLVNGENVRLYIVDERAPGDRVYEILTRTPDAVIEQIVPVGESIGNNLDERHAVLAHKITAYVEGKPHLEIVQ
jgi:hypothetical protein